MFGFGHKENTVLVLLKESELQKLLRGMTAQEQKEFNQRQKEYARRQKVSESEMQKKQAFHQKEQLEKARDEAYWTGLFDGEDSC